MSLMEEKADKTKKACCLGFAYNSETTLYYSII